MAGLRTPIKDDNKVACHSERDSHPESCPELVSGSFQDIMVARGFRNRSGMIVVVKGIMGQASNNNGK